MDKRCIVLYREMSVTLYLVNMVHIPIHTIRPTNTSRYVEAVGGTSRKKAELMKDFCVGETGVSQ